MKFIVFIHGILSGPSTFQTMRDQIEKDPDFKSDDWAFGSFEYDYNSPMEQSAAKLREFILAEINNRAHTLQVDLVCHSMGGLVARLALICHGSDLSFIRRVIMLGTPNFGALSLGRLSLLSHLIMDAGATVWPIFCRQTGIRDLTKAQARIMENINRHPDNVNACIGIQYITIPGMFFHEEAPFYRTRPDFMALGFTTFNILQKLSSICPLLTVSMNLPHDGIVEAENVNMDSSLESRFSEKNALFDSLPPIDYAAYAHVRHPVCKELLHTDLQRDDTVIFIVKMLLKAESLEAFSRQRPGNVRVSLKPDSNHERAPK